MMQLLSAWKESLVLFKPSNLKLFLLVTLKSLVDTYKVWFRYWWWLIGLVLAGPYLISSLLNCLVPVQGRWIVAYETFSFAKQGLSSVSIIRTYEHNVVGFPLITYGIPFLVTCVLSVLYVSLYLCARPSVAIKNWDYFKGYGKHTLYITLWFLLLDKLTGLCWLLIKRCLFILDMFVGENMLVGLMLLAISFAIVSSVSLLFIIFLLDSDASPKAALYSLCRAGKMTVYNLPFFLISFVTILIMCYMVVGVFLFRVVQGVSYFIPAIAQAYSWILRIIIFNGDDLGVIFMPIVACVFINYYIKKIHEQFTF